MDNTLMQFIFAMLIVFDLLILLILWVIDSNTRKRAKSTKLLIKEVNIFRREIGSLRNEMRGYRD